MSIPVAAKAQDPPQVVTHAEVEALAGEWFEVASTGTWWHRRCASDTRYRFDGPRSGRLQASTACTAGNKVQHQRGTLRGSRTGDGRLSIRFTPRLFRWLSATWSDFWILSAGDRLAWLLVGDNSRERLFVISRTVVLDEAAMAQALAEARRQGYDIERLAHVPQPAGAAGLAPRR